MAQLLKRAALDLPHPLFGDSEPGAKRFERCGLFRKLAMAHDVELARVEAPQSLGEPGDAPVRVNRRLGERVR